MLEIEMEWYERGTNSPFYIAGAYAALGEKDAAFEWLEKSFARKDYDLTYLKTNSRFKSLHTDPRYLDLLRRVGLPTN